MAFRWQATAEGAARAVFGFVPRPPKTRSRGNRCAAWRRSRSARWQAEDEVAPATRLVPYPAARSRLLFIVSAGCVRGGQANATGQSPRRAAQAAAIDPLPAAGSWSVPATLATPAASAIRQVSVAVNSSGAAVVGWIRQYNTLFGDVITRPAGGSFGAPATIATSGLRRNCSNCTSCRSRSMPPAGPARRGTAPTPTPARSRPTAAGPGDGVPGGLRQVPGARGRCHRHRPTALDGHRRRGQQPAPVARGMIPHWEPSPPTHPHHQFPAFTPVTWCSGAVAGPSLRGDLRP